MEIEYIVGSIPTTSPAAWMSVLGSRTGTYTHSHTWLLAPGMTIQQAQHTELVMRKSFDHVVNDIASKVGLKARQFGDSWWIEGMLSYTHGVVLGGRGVWGREVILPHDDAETINRELGYWEPEPCHGCGKVCHEVYMYLDGTWSGETKLTVHQCRS